MTNQPLRQHDNGVVSSTPALESEPLLQQSQRQGRTSTYGIDTEDPSVGTANTGASVTIKQIFTVKLFAVMLCFLTNGLCTTGIGALIGGIESYYNITDGPTAFIFPAGVAGYLFATLVLQRILDRYGWRGAALLASSGKLVSSLMISAGPPFPVVLPAYFALGIGTGLSDCAFCAWGSKVPFANVVQGMIHGSFSIGAVLGPIFALALTQQSLGWYTFYRLFAALSCLEIAAFGVAFNRETAERYLSTSTTDSDVETKHPLRLAAVWICGVFYFFYVGVESSFSDWAIEFMKRIRHLDPALASLSSSIFWIGMTLGRLSLGPVTEKFGLEKCVSTYIALSVIFQLLFKFTPNPTASLVFLGVNGICLGPMFPSGIVLIAKKVPSRSKIGAVATVNAMGQLGGASAPLAIGLLADSFGIGRMLDIVLGLSFVLLTIWLVFCRLPHWSDT